MPQTFYSKEEVKSLEHQIFALGRIAHIITNYCTREVGHIQRENKSRSESRGQYHYIPNGDFSDFFVTISQILGMLKQKDKYARPLFIDAGCGFPNFPIYADALGYTARGYEIDDTIINLAKKFDVSNYIEKVDILKADYSQADVVYYYHPFYDVKKEKDFERYVEDTVKVGAFIIPIMKRDDEIRHDSRFKVHHTNEGGYGRVFFEKIKAKKESKK